MDFHLVFTPNALLHWTNRGNFVFFQCLKDLQGSSLPEASKLTEFLARNEVEELLEAHDVIVRNFFPETEVDVVIQDESIYKSNINQDPNIRIIRIEKTNEPLVRLVVLILIFR